MSQTTKTDEFADIAHRGINEAQQKIETMQLKCKLAQADTKQELEQNVERLEQRKQELEGLLEELRQTGNEASSTLMEGCRESWQRFSQSVEEAAELIQRRQ